MNEPGRGSELRQFNTYGYRFVLATQVRRPRRFDPVEASELAGLSLHVSVLGELRPIAPEAIEVGVHGLVIRGNGRSGLLLPQVAAERGWDRERFLDETCRKAGLPAGTWRTPGCEILAFTAVVFGEDEADES